MRSGRSWKTWKRILPLACLGVCLALGALADGEAPLPTIAPPAPAEDITMQCALNGYWGETHPGDMRDDSYRTFWESKKENGTYSLTVTAPKGKRAGGVLIRWRSWPVAVNVQVDRGGAWETVASCGADFVAQYIKLPDLVEFRIVSQDNGQTKLQISEITLVTSGELPKDFQVWRKPPKKVDLMLIAGHPDDEVLWFGGLLPTYAGEQGKDVLVVNGAFNNYVRRLELCDCLWTCGVDIYPVIMNYNDVVSWNMGTIYEHWGGREKVVGDIVELYRRYHPDVVVLHAQEGESGHGAHQALSDAGRRAVALAADAAQYPESAQALGVWQVPKVYVHLWPEQQIKLDWHVPLSRFGGLDGLAVADLGFQQHKSQLGGAYSMEDGGELDNSLFGLYFTAVGPDELKNDLFENLPENGEEEAAP